MAGKMIGERVERGFDLVLVRNSARRARLQGGEEGVAEGIAGEQAVQVAAGDAAVGLRRRLRGVSRRRSSAAAADARSPGRG